MEKRIYGLETEYGIITLNGSLNNRLDEILAIFMKKIFEKIAPMEPSGYRDGFFLNGARIYRDTGDHPEYSSPECAGIKDLVKWDKAGERIFEEMMAETNRCLQESELAAYELRLFKNNRDAELSTFGCHENYLVSRRVENDYLEAVLIPFLVSRLVICGAGYVGGGGFEISQRARFISRISESSSTQSRPIIHTRDEPWADRNKWRRLHLILGDANMSEVSTFLKVGTTALVLRMIEDNFISGEAIRIYGPVEALKEFSGDPECRVKVRLERSLPFGDSPWASAVEIQETYLGWAREYLDSKDEVEPEWREVVSRWESVLEALKENPMKLYRQIDWVTKKWLVESVLEKFHRGWSDLSGINLGSGEEAVLDVLRTIDFQYHDIRQDSGLYNLLANEGIAERMWSEEEIQKAKTEAPQDTRAKWRADFIRLAREERFRRLRFKIESWESASIFTPPRAATSPGEVESYSGYKYFRRENPFDAASVELEEVLERLK